MLGETNSRHREIVLVDSASTDDTVHRAQRYPVRIARLHGDQPLTAAKGRCLGFQQTDGRYVLFLDGDCELVPGWLDQGIQILDDDGSVAAVGGTRINLTGASEAVPGDTVGDPGNPSTEDVRHFGGNILRTSARTRSLNWRYEFVTRAIES